MKSRITSIDELQRQLGERLKRLRVFKRLDQHTLADQAGVSTRALSRLETGKGSTLETLLRILYALQETGAIDALAPEPTIDPVAMLRTKRMPTRVRRPARRRKAKSQ
ncbi:MAG: helix-turn-helix transcriptional regulator [Gammaproteobacteria bacterium]|nr:helix-turn-helix transcriptional regulator [Gammaproteobacteria bacterium]